METRNFSVHVVLRYELTAKIKSEEHNDGMVGLFSVLYFQNETI